MKAVLRWRTARGDVAPLALDRIRETRRRESDTLTAESWNKALYNRVSMQPELLLLASHDILMHVGENKSDSVRSGPGDTPAVLKRDFNPFSPVTVLFVAWTGLPVNTQPWNIFWYHPQSMKVMYIVRDVLRQILDIHEARAIGDGLKTSDPAARHSVLKAAELAKNFMAMISPGASVAERATQHATCCVAESF